MSPNLAPVLTQGARTRMRHRGIAAAAVEALLQHDSEVLEESTQPWTASNAST